MKGNKIKGTAQFGMTIKVEPILMTGLISIKIKQAKIKNIGKSRIKDPKLSPINNNPHPNSKN